MPTIRDKCGDTEDNELVIMVAAGDRTAFECLYSRHSQALLAFLVSRTNAATAEDLLHDVFIMLWEKPPVGGNRQVRSWLFEVARNKLIDHYRKKGNRQQQLDDDVQDIFEDELLAEEKLRKTKDSKDCVDHLEMDYRVPVIMWMQGDGHQAIAAHLGVSVGASEKRVHRGKARVIDCMKQKGWEV